KQPVEAASLERQYLGLRLNYCEYLLLPGLTKHLLGSIHSDDAILGRSQLLQPVPRTAAHIKDVKVGSRREKRTERTFHTAIVAALISAIKDRGNWSVVRPPRHNCFILADAAFSIPLVVTERSNRRQGKSARVRIQARSVSVLPTIRPPYLTGGRDRSGSRNRKPDCLPCCGVLILP